MRPIQQWPHSVAGCFASGCECRLRDNPCCSCGRGEADGEEQWPGPCRGRQWLTQPLKLQRMPGAKPEPWTLLMSHGALGPIDNTFKDGPWVSEELQTALKEQQSRVLALWTGLKEDYWGDRKREVNPTQAQKLLAWLRRAPQVRAPSGSGGKRRTLVSWIRLAPSLEETKRKGARWAAFYLHLKGQFRIFASWNVNVRKLLLASYYNTVQYPFGFSAL